MRNIKPYRLFENDSHQNFDLFKSEVNDYLSNLTDNNYEIGDIDLINSKEDDYIYTFQINKSPFESTFIWKDIKDDINRFLELSTFRLKTIRYYDDNPHKPIYHTSTSKIPDDQEIIYIQFYLIK